MPAIQPKSSQSSIEEECLAIMEEESTQAIFKLVDDNKEVAPAGLFTINPKDKGERLISLNENLTCQHVGLYIFESSYHNSNKKVLVNRFCINITRAALNKEPRKLADESAGGGSISPEPIPIECLSTSTSLSSGTTNRPNEVTNTQLDFTYTIQYPAESQSQKVFPVFSNPECFPESRVKQYLESVSYMNSTSSSNITLSYPMPAYLSAPQTYDNMPLLEFFAGENGELSLKTDFVNGTSLIGTQIVLKIQNLFDNLQILAPSGYTIVTISVLSGAKNITDRKVQLNQPLTETFTFDSKVVTNITLFPSVKGGPDPALFSTFSALPLLELTIAPKFGNQINTYYSIIQVVYDDLTNENLNLTILVTPSYPHLISEPNLLSTFTFGRSYTSDALTNQVKYSDVASNPSLTLTVFEKSTQVKVTLNPLTYNPDASDGNTLTYNCFSGNGIQGGKSYDMTITLSEDGVTPVVYGPYTFDVLNPTTPVFVDSLKNPLSILKQSITIDQLPDVNPLDTQITVTLEDWTPIPSNIMNFDPTSRKMTYYFDNPTGGTESVFFLLFTLTSQTTGTYKEYTQVIAFDEISNGVYFTTPPPNITATIGAQTLYSIPALNIVTNGTFPCSLNYPSSSISATWTVGESCGSLSLNPTFGQSGTFPFQFVVYTTATLSLFYNFTVTVPVLNNFKPVFEPSLMNQRAILGILTTYELPNIVDLDNDTVSISVNSNNGSSFISFDSTNTFLYNTGTIDIDALNPQLVAPGTYTIVFDLNDTKEITKYSLNIEVYANTPPVFSGAVIPLPQVITMTSSDLMREIPFPPPTDFDNQTLTLTVDGSSLPSFIIVDTVNHKIEINPISSLSDFGNYTVKVAATDQIDITSFTFSIIVKNQPPTIEEKKSLQKVYDVDSPPITEIFNLNDYFIKNDPDFSVGDILGQYYTNQSLPIWLPLNNDQITVNISDPSILSLGTTTVDIYVKDLLGESSLTPMYATFILDRAPYYSDASQLNQVITCCNVEPLTLPIPLDNKDTLSQIKVQITPSPPIQLITTSPAQFSVDTSQLIAGGSNPFTVVLTDTLELSRSYTGSITLNRRPEWTLWQPPVSSVTVLSGGEIQCVEYGSIHSSDPDSHSYKVIWLPSEGLPQGLIVNVVNSTNITVQAQSGFNIAGNYTIRISLQDVYGASSLTFKNLTIMVVGSTQKALPQPVQVNMGPPFFVGVDQLPDVSMEIGTTVKKVLPQIDDPDSQDSWSISIDNFQSSGLYQFTSLSYPRLTFSPQDSSHSGFYLVTLVLKDNRGSVSRYSFNLFITDPLFFNNNDKIVNSTTATENQQESHNDTTIETISDSDTDLFESNDSVQGAQKIVYLPKRMIAERAKLSQELIARISKIDSVGVLTVQFNRDVKIPTYFNSFNQSILEITLINKTNSKLRVLDAIKTVEVINQDKKLDFKWTIKSFSPRKVTFKIDFDQPLEVSNEVTHIFL